MSVWHIRTMARLAHQHSRQLGINPFEVHTNTVRLRYMDETSVIPDVPVVAVMLLATDDTAESASPEVFGSAMPFFSEVWLPSTGGYEVDRKFSDCQRRGDAEIGHSHPYERTLTIWRRGTGSAYKESVARGGRIPLPSLPRVVIDIVDLFDVEACRTTE